MQVLDCFTLETPELRLTDLSERLRLSKAQVLRILSTLESGGYLTRDPVTKRYRLGVHLFHLGTVARQQMDIRRVAQPQLRWLLEETQETAALFVPDPLGPICVDVLQSPKAMRVFAQLGSRMPWNAGTSPKVILAHLPEEERERFLSQADLKRYTPYTVTDPDALREVLCQIRRDGYHIGDRDLDEGAMGIGAPIFDHAGRIAGAIGVAAPATRLPNHEVARFVDLVRTATSEISRQLGYHLVQSRAADD
ncbi:MAG: IclR family transcriptional regulator [Thermomicrobiales bacterium]